MAGALKNNGKGKDSITKKGSKYYEKITCFIVLGLVLLLLAALLKNIAFLPAFLITVGLELFCIAYYYIDNKKKKSLVYGLFELGVFLVVSAIIYTIINIV